MVRPDTGLSPRETEILELVVQGRTNPEIQELLGLNRKTLGTYISNIYDKAAPELPEGDHGGARGRRALLKVWGEGYLARRDGNR